MHIAFVTPESPYGSAEVCGVAAYLRAIIPAIAAAGHRVTVIANAKDEGTFDAVGRVSVREFRLPSVHWHAAKLPLLRSVAPLPLRQLEWSIAFYRQVARVAATNRIDVIESTEAGSLFLNRIAPLVIRLHGSERMFREHSGKPLNASIRWNDSLEALACERAAAITAPSKFHAQQIAGQRAWRSDRVRVIPNAISPQLLEAAAEFQRNGSNERIVLYTGRLAPVKGIETLLAAAKLVRESDPSVTFVLAGPWQMPQGPEAYGIKDENGIRWLGAQDQQQLVEWYKRASVLVMPSNYETFGLSAIEGLAFGNTVIATDGTAVREMLGDLPNALFVPRGDASALAQTIAQEMNQPHRPKARIEIQSALKRYQPDRVAAQTLEVYESVCRGNSK